MSKRTCTFEGCIRPHLARDLCSGHYHQWRRGEALRPLRVTGGECRFEGCKHPVNSLHLCSGHYTQHRKGKPLVALREAPGRCSFGACKRRVKARGLCPAHYRQSRKGTPLKPLTDGRAWDSVEAEQRFESILAERGFTDVGPYVKMTERVRAVCPDGHVCGLLPNDVVIGKGNCPECSGKNPTVIYVVQASSTGDIKLGVTNGSGATRLRDHERDGFDLRIRLHTDLPKGVALPLERSIKRALRAAGHKPVRGYEYFTEAVLPVVLALVDGHPDIPS